MYHALRQRMMSDLKDNVPVAIRNTLILASLVSQTLSGIEHGPLYTDALS